MKIAALSLVLALCALPASPQTIPVFPIETDGMTVTRLAQPGTYFDKTGRRCAVLGDEGGTFEAWAYPLKLVRNAEFSFLLGGSTTPIRARDIVRRITATPAASTLTFAYQSFTVRATFITPVDEPGALILLDVNTTEPLTIVCSFLPVLQPMWPAGLGGQSAYWDDALKAYLITEPTKRNHAYFGSPAATGISYTPAHMLSDVPSQFTIRIDTPASVHGRFIPVAIAGGKGPRDSVKAVYQRLLRDPRALYRNTLSHFQDLAARTLRVTTPDSLLNLAFAWSRVSYDNLLVQNPDLGRGLVAGLAASGTSGRPGFGWFFGGDTYINAFSLNSICAYQTTRDAVAFTRQWQRTDGKMAHELTQAAAYLDWFKEYPYAYIHGDTSPFYITAVEDYFRSTADTAFVRESWASLRKAYAWSRSTDADGDGLMDNNKAGLGASEYGSLTEVQSDIYTAAVWVKALHGMAVLSTIVGDEPTRKDAEALAAKAEASWREKFWDEQRRRYAYAFDVKGIPLPVGSPWSTVGLMWRLGDSARSQLSLRAINGAEFTTDWGIRSISDHEPMYEPLNYNYGAAWPFLSSWVGTAEFVHHNAVQGYHIVHANARHLFENGIGTIMELYSGNQNVWPAEGVPHQGFSIAGFVLPFVRGLLGLAGDAPAHRISFAPQIPMSWDSLTVLQWSIGQATFGFRLGRTDSSLTLAVTASTQGDFTLEFSPSLPAGSAVRRVLINNSSVPFHVVTAPSSLAVRCICPAVDGTVIHIEFTPSFALLPPEVDSQTGDPDRGVKVVEQCWKDSTLEITLDGLAETTTEIPIWNLGRVRHVEGGTKGRLGILVAFPDGKTGEFSRKTIRLE